MKHIWFIIFIYDIYLYDLFTIFIYTFYLQYLFMIFIYNIDSICHFQAKCKNIQFFWSRGRLIWTFLHLINNSVKRFNKIKCFQNYIWKYKSVSNKTVLLINCSADQADVAVETFFPILIFSGLNDQ